MSFSSKEYIPLVGEDIVIIGDGPIALMIAIKLKQQKVKNVSVVGLRHGEYTRSGDVALKVFEDVSKAIAPLEVKPSHGQHIKDIERQLYIHAKTLGVTFINQMFVGFAKDREIILQESKQSEKTSTIHADILMVCTGAHRAGLTEFNQEIEQKEAKFTVQSVGERPHKQFASLRIQANYKDNIFFNFNHEHFKRYKDTIGNHDPIAYTNLLIDLQKAPYNWESLAIPDCYINTLLPFTSEENRLKGTLYVEVPKNLKDQADLVSYTQRLLMFFYEDSKLNPYYNLDNNEPVLRQEMGSPVIELHKESKKYTRKPVASSFSGECFYVKESFFPGDGRFPAIFHLGDVSLNAPFQLARGLREGISRTMMLHKSWKIKDGRIVGINAKNYSSDYQGAIESFINSIETLFKEEQRRIRLWENEALHLVHQAYISANPEEKEKIKPLFENPKLRLKITSDLQYFSNRQDQMMTLTRLYDLKEFLSEHEQKMLTKTTLDLVKNHKKRADDFKSGQIKSYFRVSESENLKSAINSYQIVLQAYPKLPDPPYKEILVVYLNSIIVANKLNDTKKVLQFAKEVEQKVFPHINPTENKSIIEDITYHTALAEISQASQLLRSQSEIDKQLERIQHLIERLPKESESAKKLSTQYSDLCLEKERQIKSNHFCH